MFGEAILQPEDDVWDAFNEAFDSDPDEVFTASEIELDPNFGWTCLLHDDFHNELQAHDFESENQLRDWLAEQEVQING